MQSFFQQLSLNHLRCIFAHGQIRDEVGKTKVLLMNIEDIEKSKDKFVFDHYKILKDWLKNRIKKI